MTWQNFKNKNSRQNRPHCVRERKFPLLHETRAFSSPLYLYAIRPLAPDPKGRLPLCTLCLQVCTHTQFFFSSSFVWGREGNVKDTARSHSKWRLFWKRKIILWRVTHGNVCARVCPSSWMNCTRRKGCNEWKRGLPSMKSAEQNEAIKKEKVSLEIFVNFYDFSLIKKRLFSEKCICPTVCFK